MSPNQTEIKIYQIWEILWSRLFQHQSSSWFRTCVRDSVMWSSWAIWQAKYLVSVDWKSCLAIPSREEEQLRKLDITLRIFARKWAAESALCSDSISSAYHYESYRIFLRWACVRMMVFTMCLLELREAPRVSVKSHENQPKSTHDKCHGRAVRQSIASKFLTCAPYWGAFARRLPVLGWRVGR